MARHTGTTVALVALVLCAGVAASASSQQTPVPIDPDSTVLRATVAENGTAHWRIEYRLRLDDENATEAFETLRRDIEENTSAYRERFAERMRRTVADAENATGRDMAVRNVTVETGRQQLPQEYGVVTYRFAWVGFAAVDDDRIRAGDALAGLFLDDGTALVLAWPDGYHPTDVAPQPDSRGDRAVVWTGPTDFGPDEPRLVVVANATGPGDGANGADDPPPGSVLPSPLPLPALAAAALLAVALGGALLVYRARDGGRSLSSADGSTDGTGEATGAANVPSPELMSSEERVLALLESHGGRMKQRTVTEELGWTDARTSQVVRQLREDGKLETFRKGRENVLALPDEGDT